jgi:hypothetical protein
VTRGDTTGEAEKTFTGIKTMKAITNTESTDMNFFILSFSTHT